MKDPTSETTSTGLVSQRLSEGLSFLPRGLFSKSIRSTECSYTNRKHTQWAICSHGVGGSSETSHLRATGVFYPWFS